MLDDWLNDDAAFDRDWELATGGNLMVGEEMFSSMVDSFLDFGGYDDAIWSNFSNWRAGDNKAVESDGKGGWQVAASLLDKGAGLLEKGVSAANKVGGWMEENKTLTGLLGAGLLSALKGKNTDYTDAVKAKEEVDLRTRQRISDSLTGMGTPTVSKPGVLTRVNGQQIFKTNGGVVR